MVSPCDTRVNHYPITIVPVPPGFVAGDGVCTPRLVRAAISCAGHAGCVGHFSRKIVVCRVANKNPHTRRKNRKPGLHTLHGLHKTVFDRVLPICLGRGIDHRRSKKPRRCGRAGVSWWGDGGLGFPESDEGRRGFAEHEVHCDDLHPGIPEYLFASPTTLEECCVALPSPKL